MKRKLVYKEDDGLWKIYSILLGEAVDGDYYQGEVRLPFNPESKKNSEEILATLTKALGEPK